MTIQAGDYFYPTYNIQEYLDNNFFKGSQLTIQKLNVLYNLDNFFYNRMKLIYNIYDSFFSFYCVINPGFPNYISKVKDYTDGDVYKFMINFTDLEKNSIYNYKTFVMRLYMRDINNNSIFKHKVINIKPLLKTDFDQIRRITHENNFLVYGNDTSEWDSKIKIAMATLGNELLICNVGDKNCYDLWELQVWIKPLEPTYVS